MTAIAPLEGTGPIHTATSPTASEPSAFGLAAYLRDLAAWVRDLVRWADAAAHHYTVELPIVTLAAGAAGVVMLTLIGVGIFAAIASAVLS